MKKLLLSAAIVWGAFAASSAHADPVPSCFEFAKEKVEPGASPLCAPIRIPNDMAFKILKNFSVNRISFDYYVFASADWWEKETVAATKWTMLTTIISSIQSLYGHNSNVTLAILPKTYEEKLLPSFGEYPLDKIVAQALYNGGTIPIVRMDDPPIQYPANHHERLYTMIVY